MQTTPTTINDVANTNGIGIPVADILCRFQTVMMDAKSIRWPQQDAFDWMNDGASEIVLRRPSIRHKA